MPLSALYEAAFKYQQLSGIDAAVEWHMRELARLRVSRAAIDGSRQQAADCPGKTDEVVDLRGKLALATEALEFYADESSWRKGRGGKPSLIEDDNQGDLARETLAKLEGDASGSAE